MNFKTIALLLVALVIGTTVGVAGLKSIEAATSSGSSSLINNLAKKFNTTTDNVKSVFDQTKADNQAARQKEIETNLTQAVKDGKISESQKSTILSKLANIEKQMQEAQSAREDLKTWAEDNKVDLSTVLPEKGFGPHGRMGRF